MPRCSPGSTALESGGSGSQQLSMPAPLGSGALPELVQHVAAHEAAMLNPRTISPQPSGSVEWDDSMLLPPHLREWVVDASQLTYLRRADGSLWQIGSGASSKVYRVEYRGEVRCAVLRCAARRCAALRAVGKRWHAHAVCAAAATGCVPACAGHAAAWLAHCPEGRWMLTRDSPLAVPLP